MKFQSGQLFYRYDDYGLNNINSRWIYIYIIAVNNRICHLAISKSISGEITSIRLGTPKNTSMSWISSYKLSSNSDEINKIVDLFESRRHEIIDAIFTKKQKLK
jgi:hypothetical protein